jgi:hypothetical protein
MRRAGQGLFAHALSIPLPAAMTPTADHAITKRLTEDPGRRTTTETITGRARPPGLPHAEEASLIARATGCTERLRPSIGDGAVEATC